MAPCILNLGTSYILVASYTPRTIYLSTHWVCGKCPAAGLFYVSNCTVSHRATNQSPIGRCAAGRQVSS